MLAIVAVALVFDFINGFHDSANSIATIVSTRVLSPVAAVAWAAFFNFAAAFGFGTAVAKTIGSGLIDLSIVDPVVILAGLLGAISWDIATWYFGIPSSSSHALIGGYGGAAVAKAGVASLILGGWVKPILFIFVAPILGMVLGLTLMVAVAWTFRRARPVAIDKHFRRFQLVS
ncbi:MAG: inorganic phosphate transporter, partial [Gemmatimonadota bacterium]|nr:inorganic phosphate transporter [Gemmatimonadota bacterium]